MRNFAKNSRFLTGTLALLLLATGCSSSDDKTPLPGERLSILELQRSLEPEAPELDAQGFVAPSAWANEFWPQAGGYPNHAMQHLALNEGELKRVWSADIGKGSSRRLPLTAQPIVVDGRAYTLDTDSKLKAFDLKTGKSLWTADVRDKEERDPVISGGIAYSRGTIYVTAGYDEVLAVKPSDGTIKWRARIAAPSRAAPTVMEDRLFIATLDNRLLALSTQNGETLWEHTGFSEGAGLVGSASPAANRDIVIPAYSSGELFALRAENGSVSWSENLASFRALGGLGGISDIRGLPIIDKGIVFAVSFGGRLAAIDERTGTRIWQREIGSSETPWAAGNHLFVVSVDNEVVALGRDNGVIRWVKQLPRYENEKKRKGQIFWTSPVLAGGRLILANTIGDVVEMAPETGEIIRVWSAGKSFSITPIVAGKTLYLLDDNGTLTAYQ